MGLFNRTPQSGQGAGGGFMDVVRRAQDVGALIYRDPQCDFNTNSVIVVPPNAQAIFIKNGEIFGILPPGRHEVKSENYPFFRRLRDLFTSGASSFTCEVYHVSTSITDVKWGTSSPIEIQDFFLGRGRIGVKTELKGAAIFQIRFDVNEDDTGFVKTFLDLVGDKSYFMPDDLSRLFHARFSQKISRAVGDYLEEMSKTQSINGISRRLEEISENLTPIFSKMLANYGLHLEDFSFEHLHIEEDEIRQKYYDRNIGAANAVDPAYNVAFQQEIMKDIANNENGGIAGAGAGLGMGIAAGGAYMGMAANAFAQPGMPAGYPPQGYPQQQQPPQPPTPQQDPVALLEKMKEMLDKGLISQQIYDAKVAEIMSRI